MSASWILVGALVWYALAYRWYGGWLSRTLGVDPERKTPAHERYDGVDYVPAKNWVVLFGHHFSSICGAGPIIGPALAVAYWGWGPSLVWVLVGSVLLGAVADFTSLFVSVRSGGSSIPEIARPEISDRARLLFSWFIWLALVLVIAVFAIFSARTFLEQPDTVVPSWGLVPVALLVGHLLYRTRVPNLLATFVGLGLLVLALWAGSLVPVELPDLGWASAESIWILALLAYCFAASITPVQTLLQPRDYIASFVLFAAIGLGIASVFVSAPEMQQEALHSYFPSEWPGAGPLWPMLFVTIACGAISGFHSLVSSGTTCKQLANEAHACRVGYGGMLMEGLVGVLVVLCVGAGLSHEVLSRTLREGGPISAFSAGYGSLSFPILGDYGRVFAVMALNAFLLTTLDTATRIGRYLTEELFGVRNLFLSTGLVVAASGALALTGQWGRLWPAFGTSNQLIAALSLLVASCWLVRRGRPVAPTLVPALVMLVTTLAAFFYQLYRALQRPDWFLASVVAILIVLAVAVFREAVASLAGGLKAREASVAPG
ncbi:MAG: carbon starvation protein A [Candidatus Binatia bacterium]|nr:MAG: carbon starvation protein A [Candidatus Binatia bacterium]